MESIWRRDVCVYLRRELEIVIVKVVCCHFFEQNSRVSFLKVEPTRITIRSTRDSNSDCLELRFGLQLRLFRIPLSCHLIDIANPSWPTTILQINPHQLLSKSSPKPFLLSKTKTPISPATSNQTGSMQNTRSLS